MNLSYQGERRTYNESEKSRLVTYAGTKEELQTFMDGLNIGSGDENGEYITSVALTQKEGSIWQLELTYTDPTSGEIEKPNSAYGKKSAQLSCGCLSMPLETHPNYLINWNYYLIGKAENEEGEGDGDDDDTTVTLPATPSWWESAVYGDKIPAADRKKYRWVKDMDSIPDGWEVLEVPQKKGVETYDYATYQITETIKCKSARSAGQYAANIINTIRSPENNLGISGGDWKCDNATVSYDGKAWIATMTYTLSGDEYGWDKDLYQ